MKHICDNCGWKGNKADEIDNIEQRVDAGSEVPSGQCPKCGALCYVCRKENPELSRGEKIIQDAIVYLGAFKGLAEYILDGNKKPDEKFLRSLVRDTPKVIKKLKKLIP